MTARLLRAARVVGAVLVLTACASVPPPAPRDESVVLLPGPDGQVGALTVAHAGRTERLTTAYATATLRQEGRLEVGSSNPEQVRGTFGEALDAQPPRPIKFVLYFQGNSDELTAESRAELAKILPALAARPAPEIIVVGHTDTMGTLEYNDALSLKRADRLRSDLVQIGIPREQIQTAGRGKRELLVRTGDGVAEPRNRRVEITVR